MVAVQRGGVCGGRRSLVWLVDAQAGRGRSSCMPLRDQSLSISFFFFFLPSALTGQIPYTLMLTMRARA